MEKITVILLHYNQRQYIYEAIDSILKQDYENIELIINDDCSRKFDSKEIEEYINKHQHGNINLKINVNKKNVGIIKSVNNCISMATGKYVTFFAADDALNNKKVVSNYVKCFERDPKYDIWSLQCLMYDKDLEELYYKFVDGKAKRIISKWNKKNIYTLLCTGCFLAIGATVFKREILINNPFDESYSVIEDWPYYISMVRKGYKIGYCDFPALNHRDGGISHSNNSPLAKKYIKDLMDVYNKEIFPYFNKVKFIYRLTILNNYEILLRNVKYKPEEPPRTFNFKLTKIIKRLLDESVKLTYNHYILLDYIYIFLPCLLAKIIYNKIIFLKIFFWTCSLPVLLVILVCLLRSLIRRTEKLIFNDKEVERR